MSIYDEWLGEEYRQMPLREKARFWLGIAGVIVLLPPAFIIAICIMSIRISREIKNE